MTLFSSKLLITMYKKFKTENCWTRFGSLAEPIVLSEGGFISASLAEDLFGVSKRLIYELIKRSGASTTRGPMNSLHFHLAEFTEWLSVQKVAPVSPIKEKTYSLKGAIEASGFGQSWVYMMAERHNVTRIRIAGRTHFCKREMDEMLSEVLPLYSEWMTEEEASLALCVPQTDMLAVALREKVAVKPGRNTAMYQKRDVNRLADTYHRRACHA